MKNLKSGIFLFLCFLSILTTLPVHNEAKPAKDCTNMHKYESKIRASMDEMIVNDDGIYLLIEGEFVPFAAVHVDSEGLYFDPVEAFNRDRTCINRHPIWCQLCRGCGVLWCPRSCRCNR